MTNGGRSFTTAPPPPPPIWIWNKEEDNELMTAVSKFFPGKTTNELNAGNNALKAAAAEEEPWSKEEDDLLSKFTCDCSLGNETEWGTNPCSCFATNTRDQVDNRYQTLFQEFTAELMPVTEPIRKELIPNFVSDQTLFTLPFLYANSDDYSSEYDIKNLNTETATAVDVVALSDHQPGANSNGYGNQNLNRETATAANVMLPAPRPGASSSSYGSSYGNQNLNREIATAANVMVPDSRPGASSSSYGGDSYGNQNLNTETATAANVVLPEHEAGMMENSNSYGNLNTTGRYFPTDSNRQPQVIQPFNGYYGKENQNPNRNYVVNQKLPFSAVETPNPYFKSTVNYDNNYHTNNSVSFPGITYPNLNVNNNDYNNIARFPCNQATHPNLDMGYFNHHPFRKQSSSSSLPSHLPNSSSATNILQPLPYNNQSQNMVSNVTNLQRNKKAGRRGNSWSVEEHKAFLSGLDRCTWGDWRSISRRFLLRKTPAQIASHAQKFQLRHHGPNTGTKKRKSIHDEIYSLEGRRVLPPKPGGDS